MSGLYAAFHGRVDHVDSRLAQARDPFPELVLERSDKSFQFVRKDVVPITLGVELNPVCVCHVPLVRPID